MYFKPFATSTNYTASASLLRGSSLGMTYKYSSVDFLVIFDELIDISILHPLGNHRQPVLTYCHSKQRQDVWMPEVLPGNSFSAESL